MKIHSSRILCSILVVSSFLPLQAQFSPIEAQPNMREYVEKKFNAYWQSLKDFKACFTGKKVCSTGEKKAKSATISVGAFILLSILLYVAKQGPTIVAARPKLAALDQEIKKVIATVVAAQQKAVVLDQELITRIDALPKKLAQARTQCLGQAWKYCNDDLDSLAKEIADINYQINASIPAE